MSVEVLDFNTILNFLEDEEAFDRLIYDRFALLDTNHDGLLSYAEMLTELQSMRLFEYQDFGFDIKVDSAELSGTYSAMFGRFDHDSNGIVDLEEFKEETKEIMLATANGLGFVPVQMILEEGSFLKRAVEHESAKI